MSKVRITATVVVAACLSVAAIAPSSALAEFGFPSINGPGDQTVPAFPGQKAVWSGVCDLSSASTASGGYGPEDPGGVEPPTVRPNCIDTGVRGGSGTSNTWGLGNEPRWRLDPVTQAGAHPDFTASFWFRKLESGLLDENAKDLVVRLPPGAVGSPTAIPQCPAVDSQQIPPTCSAQTQVGVTYLALSVADATYPVYNTEARDTVTAEFTVGFAGQLFNVPITARGRTNGDYGVDTLNLLIPTYATLFGAVASFWGVPWATEHAKFRVHPGYLTGNPPAHPDIPAVGLPLADQAHFETNWGSIEPFISTPTRCIKDPLEGTLAVGFDVDSWDNPGGMLPDGSPNPADPNWKISNFEPPQVTGCGKLKFEPSISLRPTATVADSPSGLDVTLETPQNNDPPDAVAHNPVEGTPNSAPDYWKTDSGLATAHLKNTVVHLPAGTSFNPAAADGLEGCTTAQIGLASSKSQVLFNNDKVECPDSSMIGTLEVDSPLLPDPLIGQVYVAPQSDNPFPGSLTAIYLVAQDDERGLSVKLAGKVDLDPTTGQISTTFLDNPQLPVDKFELHFEDGPRAALGTPSTCGHYENAASLTPWSFPDTGVAELHDPFDISSMPNGLSCAERPQDRVFKPGFQASALSRQAASFTNFALNVTRQDGEQEVSGIALDMPPGLVASLRGIPNCSDAQIEAAKTRTGLAETSSSSCPVASYIGRADTLAGSGPTPLHTAGKLYLAGSYDPDGAGPKPRAPLSVLTIVPAIAGGTPGNPLVDLGNVVIRTAVNLNSETAQVHIDSTAVPYIVGGVPLRVRRISVTLDRPKFMLNPTNCDPFTVDGTIGGAADPLVAGDDVAVRTSNGFQVDSCADLGFGPRLSLSLKGGTRRADHPALRAVVNYPPGGDYANIKFASVALPRSEILDQSHIRTVCTRVQFMADECPKGSIYGFARAFTPLLDTPVEGPVYLRSSDHKLPDLVAALKGPPSQPIEVDLVGRVDSVNGGIRNTFEAAPDAPVEKFILTMRGGKKGLLFNSTNICAKKDSGGGAHRRQGKKTGGTAKPRYAANVVFTGQNGKAIRQAAPLRATSCNKAKGLKRSHRHGKG